MTTSLLGGMVAQSQTGTGRETGRDVGGVSYEMVTAAVLDACTVYSFEGS